MSLIKKNIIITGATGYLGSGLVRRLASEHWNIIILKRSFSKTHRIQDLIDLNTIKSIDIDRTPLEHVFIDNKPSIILHCATDYGRKNDNSIKTIEANLLLPLKLLILGVNNGVQYFINTDTILDKRINHYSLSKKQFVDWVHLYKNQIKCINVMLEHFYGFGDDNTKFITYIIQSLVQGIEEIKLTNGLQKRDFIYIDDVINAFALIINNIDSIDENFTEFQVGTGHEVSIRFLCEKVKEICGNNNTKLNFGALPYRENEIMESSVDISALTSLGWSSATSLVDGLTKVINKEKALVSNT